MKKIKFKPTKYHRKPYQCRECGKESEIGTNHYGECYPVCTVCGHITVHDCLVPAPSPENVPEPWKMTTLGEVLEYGDD